MVQSGKTIQTGSVGHLQSLPMMTKNDFYVETDKPGTLKKEFKI